MIFTTEQLERAGFYRLMDALRSDSERRAKAVEAWDLAFGRAVLECSLRRVASVGLRRRVDMVNV